LVVIVEKSVAVKVKSGKVPANNLTMSNPNVVATVGVMDKYKVLL
jgi:hypothetical protein